MGGGRILVSLPVPARPGVLGHGIALPAYDSEDVVGRVYGPSEVVRSLETRLPSWAKRQECGVRPALLPPQTCEASPRGWDLGLTRARFTGLVGITRG